jgi:hypothetical protein
LKYLVLASGLFGQLTNPLKLQVVTLGLDVNDNSLEFQMH